MRKAKAPELGLQPISLPQHLSAMHGFFTRQGGVSSGIYDSLNIGKGSDDLADNIANNRARIRSFLGAKYLRTVYQIHSSLCHVIDAPQNAALPSHSNIEADALVTNQPDVAIGVLSADCAPILLADPKANVIGAAHAGWRGAASGIIATTVEAMCQLGAQRDAIQAVIGPCISQPAYEVGDDFKQNIVELYPQDSDLFAIMEGASKPHFDLPRYVQRQAERAGIEAHWSGECTYSDPRRFFSYRRSCHAKEADYGRQGSFIRL